MTGPPVTLASLAFGWGDAYLFSYVRDRWVALRRDTPRFLTAGTLAGLEAAIEADYRDDPVPRACAPPGTADYLSLPDDDVPDEESRFLLAALRHAFPAWTITYSAQTRAWLARTREKTICENSPVLMCAALVLIQHRQPPGRPAPSRDGSLAGNHDQPPARPVASRPGTQPAHPHPVTITCTRCGQPFICDTTSTAASDQTCGPCPTGLTPEDITGEG